MDCSPEFRGPRNFLPPVAGQGTHQLGHLLCARPGPLPPRSQPPGGPWEKKPSAWPESLGQGTWGHSSAHSPASPWLGATPAISSTSSSLPQPSPGLGCPQGLPHIPAQASAPGLLRVPELPGLAPLWPSVLCLPSPLGCPRPPRHPWRRPSRSFRTRRLSCTGMCWVHSHAQGRDKRALWQPRGCPSSGGRTLQGPWGWRASCLPPLSLC